MCGIEATLHTRRNEGPLPPPLPPVERHLLIKNQPLRSSAGAEASGGSGRETKARCKDAVIILNRGNR